MKKRLKLKGWVKTALIILFIYLLFVGYLLFVSKRIENLDNNNATKNTSVKITIGRGE